uniref:Uncharacterized protein n=1 Tax=Glossina austeni TaxID=7395 RepID=A0A1A9V092_GLOAU
MKSFLAKLGLLVFCACIINGEKDNPATEAEIKIYKRLIPADVLRDYHHSSRSWNCLFETPAQAMWKDCSQNAQCIGQHF